MMRMLSVYVFYIRLVSYDQQLGKFCKKQTSDHFKGEILAGFMFSKSNNYNLWMVKAGFVKKCSNNSNPASREKKIKMVQYENVEMRSHCNKKASRPFSMLKLSESSPVLRTARTKMLIRKINNFPTFEENCDRKQTPWFFLSLLLDVHLSLFSFL